jgi:glucose-6-phosphate isomerase, archaeal
MNPSPLLSLRPEDLSVAYSLDSARLGARPLTERHLADLKGCFAETAAFDAALALGNPLIYAVSAVEPATGDGQLHYGLGIVQPGRIGDEYYLTKGHYHTHRAAAEVYIGLSGDGAMVLEDEATGETRLAPLTGRSVVYVPGHTAHRTVNTGTEPLVYFGIYPASAGHDYGAIARKNFSHIVVATASGPQLRRR